MEESQKHYAEQKKNQKKTKKKTPNTKEYIVWFHLYEILEQPKLLYS